MPVSDCILGGDLTGNGYARIRVGKVRVLAHRVVWARAHGRIPEGHQLHHVCGTRACINVEHLELLTPAEHRRRHRRCNHGDEHRYVAKNGCSTCRICMQERTRQRYHEDAAFREKLQAKARDRMARLRADPDWSERRNAKRRKTRV